VGRLLGADQVGLARYENEHEISVLAIRGQSPEVVRAGMRLPLDGDSVNARILRTGRSARLNFAHDGHGTIAEVLRRDDVNATVGAPIVVDGSVWGVVAASWRGDSQPPADAEERLAQFAELLDTAIANADSRDQLTASRARVLAAGDDARRRVVRDLHDGAQQRLVSLAMTLGRAKNRLGDKEPAVRTLIEEAHSEAMQAIAEIRDLTRGLHPPVLTDRGLDAALSAVAARSPVPVRLSVDVQPRPSLTIESIAYFVVTEALANVAKHAEAAQAEVRVTRVGDVLRVEVRDDGQGGADPAGGSGLRGLTDRVAGVDGRLTVDSPPGGGTTLIAEVPCG